MASIQTMINWMEQRQGKVTYLSYAGRYGPNTFDCSSAVYYSLVAGGFLPTGTPGTTDTLFTDLENLGWVKTSTPKRGDIFIRGIRGHSQGDAGHTGIFVDSVNIIHCNSSAKGISTNRFAYTSPPPITIYHCPNAKDTTPSLNTDEEKTAWTVAQILSKKGYSKGSIAGILGNMEAECGMIPDKDQNSGGPAYGLVQWDGSKYPLTGTPTSNGREYVKRMMSAAGIKGDYRQAEAQTKLVDWCMYNGQWLETVEPKKVADFKNMTDITQAATVFMRNFERPNAAHERLDVRINGAKKWYDFIKDLKFDDEDETKEDTNEGYEKMTNDGELEMLGIANGKVIASGWHFSSDLDTQYIVFMNAETGRELGRVKAAPVQRKDIQDKYPNVLGIEQSGFDVSIAVPNGTAVYVKGLRTDGKKSQELIFDKMIIFERVFDPGVDQYAETNEKFFFEIYRNRKLVKRGNKILNTLKWSNELMFVPSTELVLPIDCKEFISSREEIKIYLNQKVFHGLVNGAEENQQEGTITVNLLHVISEWEFQQISTNLAVKNRTINDIYSTLDFRYSNWNVEYMQDAAQKKIDYVYSRQSKLAGLTKTCELTDDLFWRVGFHFGRAVEIGSFGEKKPYLISTRPSGGRNIRILSEPVIRHEYENVINAATVYGEKSDGGMSSMNLREVFNQPGLQDPKFPVVVLKKDIVNNERHYNKLELVKLAPNIDLEYSIMDSESIALEGGTVIEGTFSFNDLAPFQTGGEKLSDEDRSTASKTAYDAAVKKLKQSRRKYIIDLEVEKLPHDLDVGDRVRLLYDNQRLIREECSNYLKKVLSMDDWYYITSIEYSFDSSGTEHNILSLEKFLRIERESDAQ